LLSRPWFARRDCCYVYVVAHERSSGCPCRQAPCLCTELSSCSPITFSPMPYKACGEAGFLCCVPTLVEFECEGVPLCLVPPRGRGANLAARPCSS